MHPWDGVIPDSDVASFRNGFDNTERPLGVGDRPALVVVDMTRAFVDSQYPTGWSETGYPAAEANRRLLDASRAAGIPIFFTKGYALTDYRPLPAQRGRWKNRTRPEPNPAIAPGDIIVDILTPMPGETVITKESKPSGFFGTPLASHLIYHGVDTVIVTGMTTSGCVRATVLDAFQYNFSVVIPHECVADRSQLSHKVNLFDMHMKYADVISLDETLAYLERVTGRVSALSTA